MRHRIDELGLELDEVTFDYVGQSSVFRGATPAAAIPQDPFEVVLRFAARGPRRDHLVLANNEWDALGPNGPFATGKGTPSPDRIRELISVKSTLVSREHFHHTVSIEEA